MFRCLTCVGRPQTCQECCVANHSHNPFHKVEGWSKTDGCFIEYELRSLGLTVYLGHMGKPCPHLEESEYTSTHHDILVVDTSGVQTIDVARCVCQNALSFPKQLLRSGLFPATWKSPATAFTFTVLDHFYIDSMECNTSAQSFYSKLRRLTNCANPQSVPVCCATLQQ